MATWAQLRDRVRRAVEDTDSTAYLWSDVELADYLGEGYREFGRLWPRRWTIALVGVAGQTSYALDAGVRAVLGVTVGGQAIPRGGLGDVGVLGYGQRWWDYDEQLRLAEAPQAGAAIAVLASGLWVVPTLDATVSGLPDEGEDLVVWSAAWAALQRRAVAAVKRRGASGGMGLGEVVRQRYEEARRRCQRARGSTLG